MILKNITIQNLGSIPYLSRDFKEDLSIIKSEHRDELSFALRLIFNHKASPPPSFSVGADAKIEANIRLLGKDYRILAAQNRKRGGLTVSCYDLSGADVTREYLRITAHPPEQDSTDVFSGEDQPMLPRFFRYADEDQYYRENELAKATDGFSQVKAFRRYLRDFRENFEPETLREGKSFDLVLDKNGGYAVRCRLDGSLTYTLSASEQMLFRYLCFLRTAEFWSGFEALRNLHGIKKPLLVEDFLERLDESIDIHPLIERTLRLKRQLIILG